MYPTRSAAPDAQANRCRFLPRGSLPAHGTNPVVDADRLTAGLANAVGFHGLALATPPRQQRQERNYGDGTQGEVGVIVHDTAPRLASRSKSAVRSRFASATAGS